jgi:hypothetical protein
MQGQQQGQGHLGQLQFGLSSAHSATPDPSSSHHLSQNGLQPSLGGLGGMPFGANNAATLQAAFRNPAMMNQYQNGTIARQLDRLNAATQQNTTLGALNQRPSMLQRPLQGMPGGSHLIGGPGPAPPNHMLPTAPGDNTPLPANVPDILLRFQYPQITSQSAGGPPLPPWPPRTSKDLRDWGARLKNEVMHLESQASSLSANRNGINDLETEQAVNGLRNKAQNFKVLFQMIVKMLNSIQHHASSGSVNPQNGFGSGGWVICLCLRSASLTKPRAQYISASGTDPTTHACKHQYVVTAATKCPGAAVSKRSAECRHAVPFIYDAREQQHVVERTGGHPRDAAQDTKSTVAPFDFASHQPARPLACAFCNAWSISATDANDAACQQTA